MYFHVFRKFFDMLYYDRYSREVNTSYRPVEWGSHNTSKDKRLWKFLIFSQLDFLHKLKDLQFLLANIFIFYFIIVLLPFISCLFISYNFIISWCCLRRNLLIALFKIYFRHIFIIVHAQNFGAYFRIATLFSISVLHFLLIIIFFSDKNFLKLWMYFSIKLKRLLNCWKFCILNIPSFCCYCNSQLYTWK